MPEEFQRTKKPVERYGNDALKTENHGIAGSIPLLKSTRRREGPMPTAVPTQTLAMAP